MKTNRQFLMAAVSLAVEVSSFGQLTAPSITRQPTNLMVNIGPNYAFSVSATGSQPLAYQWCRNGSELPGKTNTAVSLAAQFTNAGPYTVTVSNTAGSVTSQVAWLSVLPTNVVNLRDRELRFGQLSGPIWSAPLIDDEGPAITGDGLTLFYASRAPGGSGNLDLWMVTRPSVGSTNWGAPVNLGPTVNSSAVDTAPRLSPDGLSLYFASPRPGGLGGYDIWVATRPGRSEPFGPPVNLGPAVNSNADDGIVDISADNRTLVFGSKRPGGLGGDEIWMTQRSSAQAPWEPAAHLPELINSSYGEFPVALSRDGLLLFFKSWRPNGYGPTNAALYVCRRDSTDHAFGSPALIRPILGIGPGGADFSTLSDDGTTLYVGTYRTQYPYWPQLMQIGITPIPQLSAPRRSVLGGFEFDLVGRAGAVYSIEISTNLTDWIPWIPTTTTDRVLIHDWDRPPQAAWFYRVLSH